MLAGTPFPVPPFQHLRFGNNASNPGAWGQSPLINYVQDQQVLQKRQDWPTVPLPPNPAGLLHSNRRRAIFLGVVFGGRIFKIQNLAPNFEF